MNLQRGAEADTAGWVLRLSSASCCAVSYTHLDVYKRQEQGRGRIAAVEIMLNTPLVGDMIFKGEVAEIKELMKRSRELGMQTFDQSLFDLYEARHITYDDALRNADSVNDLRLQIKLQSQRARSNDLAAGTEHMRVV